jgi:cytidyltransferase-like protein
MKISTLAALANTVASIRANGSSVGLVSGCFDILHIGHIELFRFAKKHVDVLIVGIDNDRSVRLSKGDNRPIHPEGLRLELLSELSSIDYVFVIEDIMAFGEADSFVSWDALLNTLNPSTIITNEVADRFASSKRSLAQSHGLEFLSQRETKPFSTTSMHKLFFVCF